MQFKQVIGQEEVKNRLIRTVKENRISHAQLFSGPEGCGSLALALAYATYIQCTGDKTDDSCGTCPSCLKNSKYIHPDLHFVFPVISSQKAEALVSDDFIKDWREALLTNSYFSLNQWLEKIGAENKQGIIAVKESKAILRKLSFKTYESEYKIMIIWLPEKMNDATANKLLKIIEEPPETTLFLLISENPGQIMKTIVSRTQIVKIPRIDDQSMFGYLKQVTGLPDEETRDLVRLAEGNYNMALLHFTENEAYRFNFENFVSLMRLSFAGEYAALLKWVDLVAAAGREKQKSFLQFSLNMIRNNFMLNRNIAELAFLNSEELAFSSKFSKFIHPGNVEPIANELNKAHYHIERNGYNKVIFFDLTLNLNRLLRV